MSMHFTLRTRALCFNLLVLELRLAIKDMRYRLSITVLVDLV